MLRCASAVHSDRSLLLDAAFLREVKLLCFQPDPVSSSLSLPTVTASRHSRWAQLPWSGHSVSTVRSGRKPLTLSSSLLERPTLVLHPKSAPDPFGPALPPPSGFFCLVGVRSTHDTRCQVRLRDFPPVPESPLPFRTSRSFRLVAPNPVPDGKAYLSKSPDLPSLPAASL
jgi:hypothetical protein